MQIYTIYVATNIVNNKQYVGFDSCWPKRKQSHKNEAFNPKSHTYRTAFHNAIRKHGWKSFSWNVVYQSTDKNHTLSEMERHFIIEYNTYIGLNNGNGYNLTLGGEGQVGRKMSEETRNKKSLALKGKPSKQSRQVSTPHGTFDGVTMAAGALGLSVRTVVYRLERVSFPDWYYVDGLSTKIGISTRLGSARQISTPYGTFNSIVECCARTGISKSTVFDRVSSPRWSDWFYTGREEKRGEKPIMTPHGEFPSLAEASRQLNLTKSTIAAKLRSKRNVEWYHIKQ